MIEKYTIISEHPSLLFHKINLANTFPLIKLKETSLFVFYNNKKLVCCPANTKIHQKNSEPTCNSFHFLEIIDRWENSQDLCFKTSWYLRRRRIETFTQNCDKLNIKFYFIFLCSRI